MKVIFVVYIVSILLQQERNVNLIKKNRESKSFCNNVTMPWEDIEILRFNQYNKSDKTAQFIINSYLECLIQKVNGCKNNPEILPTTNIGKHIPSVFFQFLQCHHLK